MKLPSTITLLRVPYSYFLMPIFFFAFTFSDSPDYFKSLQFFLVFFLLVVPASYGYNSYMDDDTTPVGGLRHPPKAKPELWWVCMAMNLVSISYVFFMDTVLGILVALYIAASIAYSMPHIRLKKYAFIGAFTVAFFQGFFLYVMVFLFCQTKGFLEVMNQVNLMVPAVISFLMVLANFPLTQVYQHKVDAANGEKSLSLFLGKKGTFEFAFWLHSIIIIGFGYHLIMSNQSHLFYLYLCFIFPVLAFLFWWAMKVWADATQANFRYTEIYLYIYNTAMLLYFLVVFLVRSTDELPILTGA